MKTKTLTDLKRERDGLLSYYSCTSDPRVQEQIRIVQAERAPRVKALDKQIEELRKAQPEKKPRWPEGTPQWVLDLCNRYWSGTTEHATFRIHCWNDSAVCTSYPSGGYSDNGGWHPTQACFYFISRTVKEFGKPGQISGPDIVGRQSAKALGLELARRTSQLQTGPVDK